MVDVRAQVIYTDGVDAQNLHQRSIAHANSSIAKRVDAALGLVAGRSSGLVGHTNNLKTVASLGVDEVVALDIQGRDGGHEGGP